MSRLKKPTQVLDLTMADTTNACLQIRYIGKRETTASGGTATIAETGDDNSKLLITLVGWDAANDVAETLLYAASTTTGATVATTIQAMIDAINGGDNGFEVRRNHALSDLTTNSDDFIALSATQISTEWTNFLYRDESEYDAIGWTGRAGVPTVAGFSRIELLKLTSTSTYASGTVNVKTIIDRGSSAAEEIVFDNTVGAATTVAATIFDYTSMENPPVVSGPIAIEVIGAAVSDSVTKLLYRPLN